MATIQERLDRMKRDGLAARTAAARKETKPAGDTAALPAAGQGAVTLPRAGQMPGWASAPSFAPLPKPRTSQDIRAEMDGLDSAINDLKAKQAELNTQAQRLTNHSNTWNHRGGAGMGSRQGSQAQALRRQAAALESQITRLESDRAGLQAQWTRADDIEFDLNMIRDKDYQAAVDRAMAEGYEAGRTSFSPSHRSAHFAMEYLREKDDYKRASALSASGMALDRMSESQRNRLAYYVGTGDYDGAADYLRRIAPELNRQALEQVGQTVSGWSQENPGLGAAANVASWPLNIPAYFDNARQGIENLITGEDRQSPSLAAYLGPKISEGTAQGTQEAARNAATQTFDSETAGNVAAFLAGTGLSIGQNATQIALLGPYSLAGMSISAAGGATADALDRGASPQQAFLVGTSAGAIEAVTEKIPLEKLFRLAKEGGGRGAKAAVFEVLKQMGTEAGEEALSEIANNLVDAAVMGDSSELQLYVKELQAAGLSREEAERAALLQFYVWNVLGSAAGGAISGGVMGGGALAFNRAGQYAQQLNKGARDAGRVNAAIDQAYRAMAEKGMFSQEAGQAAQTASERLENARRGRWDGIYLPMAEDVVPGAQEGTETAREARDIPALPEGQTAPQGPLEAAMGQNNAASTGEAAGGNQGETVGVIQNLRDNIPRLSGLTPVHETSTSVLKNTGGKTIAEKARALFESIKGLVARPGFGDVEINSRAVKDDLSHGVGPAKAAVIPAIPYVIRSGTQIDFQQNWKGRAYDGYVFAAPVMLDGNTVYVAAVVKRTSKNRFYLHEVVDSSGNIIKIDNGEGANQTSLAADGDAGTPASLSNISIPQGGTDVNAQDSGASDKASAGGDRLDQIRDTVRMLREGYNQGRITEEEFDQTLDYIMEQEGLEELDMLDSLRPSAHGFTTAEEGAKGNDAGEFEPAAPGGRQLSGGIQGRISDQGAGGQNGGVAEGGSRRALDTGRAAVDRQNTGRALRLQEVSSRELGISGGTDQRTVRVLPESAWDGGLRETARKVRRETGLGVRFVLGGIQVTGTDGAVHQVRGVYSRDGIVIQADHMRVSPEQIADHEIFHSYADSDPGLIQAVEDAVVERYGREELRGILEAYAKNLRGIVDIPEAGSDMGFEQAMVDVKNEVFADAFAGINAFGAHAEQYQGEALDALEGRGAPQAGPGSENAQATDRRTGPPGQYSIDYDQDNRPFVIVEEDILGGVPRPEWTTRVKEVLAKRFPNGVRVGNDTIKINGQTRGEMTFSEYTKRLRHKDAGAYADKLRAAANADEIILASRDYVNEGLKHKRKDNIKEFARGTVQLRIGPSDYSADVVVGTTASGEMLLYDIVNLQEISIQDNKKSGAEFTAQPQKIGRAADSSTPAQSAAPASDEKSISHLKPDVKGQSGSFMLPTAEQGTVELPKGEDFGPTRFSADEDQDQAIPEGIKLPTLAELQARKNQADAGTRQEGAENTSNSDTAVPGQAADIVIEQSAADILPAKAQNYLQRTERNLANRVGELLSVPASARREFLHSIVRDISTEYLNTGRVSQETRNRLFDQAYEQGVQVDREYYDNYKHVRDYLRATPITVSQQVKGDIADYGAWRKGAFGTLRLVNSGGIGIDTAYMELQNMAPGLFPEGVTHPADQLRQILETAQGIRVSERSLDEAYGPDAEEFKRWSRRDFDEAVDDALQELRQVKRCTDERSRAKQTAQAPGSVQEVAELWRGLKGARKIYEKTAAKNLLTEHDEIQVGRLLRGELELEHLDPARDNVKGITAVYEAKAEYEDLAGRIQAWNRQRKAALREQADGFLETANQWKDKKAGILYSRETMERNIRDIVPDRELADQINRAYFQPVHEAAAKSNRAKNEYRDRVRALGLSRKAAKGDAVSEAHAVQLLGEAEDNIQMLESGRIKGDKRDGKTLEDWRGVVQNLWETSPGLDQEKIRGAVKEFRAIYDELFQQMNETRVRNGYEPVNYRKGYFPHFQPGGEGIMALFGKALGVDTAVDNLPTTINGLTHTFKPGIQWFGNAQERLGFNTAYDAVEGFDRYIEGVTDVIYQTDNIQALRALGAQARYRTGDDGLREQVDAVRAREDISDAEKQVLIDEINEKGKFALNNFVVELDEYTNLLANKKSRGDRDMEQRMGRRMYSIMKNLESRVAANMVAVNPASWLTNFVPLTQGAAALDRGMLLRGMWDTLKAYRADDGLVGMSSFLTNRRGSDPIVKTWAQGASAVLSSPMEYIDQFTADSLVRGRYQQNLKHGLSEAAAMEEADAWAAGVMADRSKGATPTLFNRSDPLTKLFTQFQLEVNNQLSYLFKDLPRDVGKKGLAALCAALLKFFLGAYLYNEVYEYFIGRRCALDPIGILNDTVGDLTGYQLPNLVELGVSAAAGDMPSFETQRKNAYETVAGLAGNVAEELPFVGGVLGGGRVPVSSALPDWENLGKAALNDDWSSEKRLATAGKELLSGPAAYLALPFGGGQIKKIYQGLKAVMNGGSYTVDNEGNDILQYPVFNETPGDWLPTAAGALLFGKSTLPTAREWAESGFKSLSAKQTACYQGMTQLGVPQRGAFELIRALGGVKGTETEGASAQKLKLLEEADISDEGKSVAYYMLMASDKERALMDELAGDGTDMGEATRVLMGLKDANALESGKSAAKKEAIAESALSEEEKDAMFRYVLGEGSAGSGYSQSFVEAGLDERSAAAVANALNSLSPGQGRTTVSDAQKWRAVLDAAGSAENQKAALLTVMSDGVRMRFEVAGSFGVQPEAWVRLKEALPQFDADGNGSYTGAEVENAIDALGGDGSLLAPWDQEPLRLSREEKAALWQTFTGNKSGSGNPYSTRVGKKAAEEMERAREKAGEKK